MRFPMSKTKLGINGLGRIGRTILRELYRRSDFYQDKIEIVAINNPGNIDTHFHLLKYDSLHRNFPGDLKVSEQGFNINGKNIKFFNEKDPTQIDWNAEKVDVVIDATGVFKDKEGLSKHLGGSVKKVIMCAPGKDLDGTFVMGINHKDYNPEIHHVISNASCTTNCLAPVAKVLSDNFGIEYGMMTTVHAYTSDQNILDGGHSDLRRARAAAMSMVPTTTGAAKAVGLVLPELKGKLDGLAIRVPTPDVSMVDLTFKPSKKATIEEINNALKKASQEELKGILAFEEDPLVSIDFLGNPNSSIVDKGLTSQVGELFKVISWYDNEVGFSNRVLDLAAHII